MDDVGYGVLDRETGEIVEKMDLSREDLFIAHVMERAKELNERNGHPTKYDDEPARYIAISRELRVQRVYEDGRIRNLATYNIRDRDQAEWLKDQQPEFSASEVKIVESYRRH